MSHSALVEQFSVVVSEPRQNLPSGPRVSKGLEPGSQNQE